MDSIAKSDIFFLVTTFAVAVLAVILVIILLRILRIIRDFQSISERIALGGGAIANDLAEIRNAVRRGILSISDALKQKHNRTKKHKRKSLTDNTIIET